MKWKNIGLETKLLFLITIGTVLVMVGATMAITSTVRNQQTELAYQQSVTTAKNYANLFDTDMQASKAMARTIASTMKQYNGDRNEVNNILRQITMDNPYLLGTYVCYEPNAFDGMDNEYVGTPGHDGTGRFVPYWNKLNGSVRLDPLLYYETSDYYQMPKHLGTDVITEPYFYEGALIVSFVSPITDNGTFIGIGGVDLSLDYIDSIVSNVTIFDTGYAFMVSNTGTLMSHPLEKEWIGFSALQEFGNLGFMEMAADIMDGNSGYVRTIDPTTGEYVVMFYEPVGSGESSFVLVVPEKEMFAGADELQRQLMTISAIAILFMGGMAFLIANSITRPISRIVSDFQDISKEALQGKLTIRANTDVDVDFKEIPQGLNDILEALEKSSISMKEMENVVNSSPVIVFKYNFNSELLIELVSDGIRNLGYHPKELTSGHIWYQGIVHPEDRERVQNELKGKIEESENDFQQE